MAARDRAGALNYPGELYYRTRLAPIVQPGSPVSVWRVPSEELLELGGFLTLRTVTFKLTTDATATDRYVRVCVRNPTGLLVSFVTLGESIVASTEASICFGSVCHPYSGVVIGDDYYHAPLEKIYLLESDVVEVWVDGLQAGDSIGESIILGIVR